MRIVRRAIRGILFATVAGSTLLAAEKDPRKVPSTRIQTASEKIPARTLFEWTSNGPRGRSRLSLFSNGLAILKSPRSEGKEGIEHRVLSGNEMEVYERFVNNLFASAPASGGTAGRVGEGVDRFSVSMTLSDGKTWSWFWSSFDTIPLTASTLAASADSLAASIRNKREIDDPWKELAPAVGERLVRVDGVVFVVTRYDATQEVAEMEAEGQPFRAVAKRSELHWTFVAERDEAAFDGGSAAPRPR